MVSLARLTTQGSILHPGVLFKPLAIKKRRKPPAKVVIQNPLQYLYEPNASLLKLGCFKLLCDRYDCFKLNPNSHLYTSENVIKGFPGRSFKIEWTSNYKPSKIRKLLGGAKANVAVRNFIKGCQSDPQGM